MQIIQPTNITGVKLRNPHRSTFCRCCAAINPTHTHCCSMFWPQPSAIPCGMTCVGCLIAIYVFSANKWTTFYSRAVHHSLRDEFHIFIWAGCLNFNLRNHVHLQLPLYKLPLKFLDSEFICVIHTTLFLIPSSWVSKWIEYSQQHLAEYREI